MTFRTTCWSELALASLDGDTRARTALDGLCRRYYHPVRLFILRRGYSVDQAEDLTQDFFVRFLEDRSWKRAERTKGSFRSFLLGAVTHHLEDATRYRLRQKRGGAVEHLSLDQETEAGAVGLPSVGPPADAQFDFHWALRLSEAAVTRVRNEYEEAGKMAQYEQLKAYLPGGDLPPRYEETAERLGVSLTGLKTLIHRLRQSFRRAVREEVADTVSAPHEIDDELRYLQTALAQKMSGSPGSAQPAGVVDE